VGESLGVNGSDGTVALVLEPLDLCARIAALIPPPRFVLYQRAESAEVVCVREELGRPAAR
jgi:hypothetical protein